ncbi:hypothetical protein OF846_004648 [Rhodotorula toruloides]|nr:hypothetical protein OF846_004648 [Rhodotorula toruloides]
MPAKTKRDDGLVQLPGRRHAYRCTLCTERRTDLKPSQVAKHTACERHCVRLRSRQHRETIEAILAQKRAAARESVEEPVQQDRKAVSGVGEQGTSKQEVKFDPDLDDGQPIQVAPERIWEPTKRARPLARQSSSKRKFKPGWEDGSDLAERRRTWHEPFAIP